jgi:exopolysaccharide/PEP-CTERM locus tyrosine autokinase
MSVFSELLKGSSSTDTVQPRTVVQKKKPLAQVQHEEPAVDWEETARNYHEPERPPVISVPTLRLNLERLARLGMVTPGLENTRVVEEYRYIKRPLLVSAFESAQGMKNPNVLVVTSSHPGEGKTFNSINLALSIAMERDHRVLLIDGDIERAGLSKTLGVYKRPGLTNYLLNEDTSLMNTMFKVSGVERLRVLPSGPVRQDAAELLASVRMKEFINEVSTRYADRMVIIDSPPLLASSSAKVLAELSGQVIIIVAADETSMSSLDESIKNVSEDKPVRLILNKTSASRKHDEYQYGYFKKGSS